MLFITNNQVECREVILRMDEIEGDTKRLCSSTITDKAGIGEEVFNIEEQ